MLRAFWTESCHSTTDTISFCPGGICGFLCSTLLQWLASLAISHPRVCWSWGEFPGQCSVGTFQGGALGKIPAGADHLDGLPPARAWGKNCEFLEGLRIPSPCWPDIFFFLLEIQLLWKLKPSNCGGSSVALNPRNQSQQASPAFVSVERFLSVGWDSSLWSSSLPSCLRQLIAFQGLSSCNSTSGTKLDVC